MPLNHSEIKSEIKIENAVSEGYGTASYDVHAGWVIKSPESKRDFLTFLRNKHEITEDGFVLPPQGMVRIVSRELFRIPPGIVCYAMVKNALSDRCLLAINTGIIDPGYIGPISSTLLNFGKEPFLITRDTKFLRLTFHNSSITDLQRTFEDVGYAAYIERTRDDCRRYSSHTFLNLHTTERRAAERAFGTYKRWVITAATLVGLAFALLSIGIPVAASVVEKRVLDSWTAAVESKMRDRYDSQMKDVENSYKEQVRMLESRIRELEQKGKR